MPKDIDEIFLTIRCRARGWSESEMRIYPYDKEEVFVTLRTNARRGNHESVVLMPMSMLRQLSTQLPEFLESVAAASTATATEGDGDAKR